MKFNAALSFLLITSLTSCQDSLTADVQHSESTRPSTLAGVTFAARPDVPAEMRMQATHETIRTLAPLFTDDQADWAATDSRLQAAIASHSGLTREMMEQAGSAQMLKTVLTDGTSETQARAAARYVETLSQYRSPEIPVVLSAVARFGPIWGPEQTAALASRAADAGEGYLTFAESCESCGMPPQVERSASERSQGAEILTARVASAVESLRAQRP